MTIKQQGGVFGRNPTFNDVEVADLQATNIDLPDNGRLRIGTGDDLQMYHNGNHSYILDAGTGDLKILGQNVEIGALDGTLGFKAISNSFATLYFNNASRARTTSAGFEITSGNLIVPSGNGIDFSATSGTGTSELFDDYEEGTWTPVVYFGGANTGMTVTTTGHYTLVGRLVVVRCSVTFSAKGSSTGTFQIAGLPFVGSINGAGAMGFNYAWATMPTGGVSFIQSSGSIYAMAANNGAYMDDTYFNDVTAINDITIAYMV